MGQKVDCQVDELDLEVESEGDVMPGVSVKCSKCSHTEESFGTTARSVRRCLALLRENCPEEERNFYVCPGGEDED